MIGQAGRVEKPLRDALTAAGLFVHQFNNWQEATDHQQAVADRPELMLVALDPRQAESMIEGSCLQLQQQPARTTDAEPPAIRPISELEREAIEMALDRFDGSVTDAAQALGISEATVYRKVKACGLTHYLRRARLPR